MSYLFNDAIRALVDCNLSGLPPLLPEEIKRREDAKRQYIESRKRLCPSKKDFYDDTFECDLPEGHDPPHVYEDAIGNSGTFRLTWLPADEAVGDNDD